LGKQLGEKHKKRKEKILKATFGKIRFSEGKTPLKSKRKCAINGWKNLNLIKRRIYLLLHNLINR